MMRVRPLYTFLFFLAALSSTVTVDVYRRRFDMSIVAAAQPEPPRDSSWMQPDTTDLDLTSTPLPTATARSTPTAPPPPATTPSPLNTATPAIDAPPPGYAVIRYPQGSLLHGHGLVVIGLTSYTIDAGQLRAAPLQPGSGVRTLTPPDQAVNGVPTKDWIDLAATGDGGLWLLDRMGDLVRYDPARNTWHLERNIVDRFQNPSQLYVALDSFENRAYILDEAQGQVWRWPSANRDEGYFPGADVWERIAQGVDITRAVDIAVDGSVYVLLREEPEPHKQHPARIRQYSEARLIWELKEGATFDRPLRLYASPKHPSLFVIDQDGMRVQELDKTSGQLIRSYALGEEIRALAIHDERLYLLSRDAIYITPGSAVTRITASEADSNPRRPDDPAQWNGIRLQPPIRGAFLPDRDSLIPGSPRLYRFGVHEGIDFYGIATGVQIQKGTPVLAAADGVVVYADLAYVEMRPAQLERLLVEAASQRNTSATTEDRLRGREVWIEHSSGLVTRYSHLSAIAAQIQQGTAVKAGQTIGFAGNSGVAAGVHASDDDVHLHFEIRIGDHYLGRWLAPLETRRLLGRLFGLDESEPAPVSAPAIPAPASAIVSPLVPRTDTVR